MQQTIVYRNEFVDWPRHHDQLPKLFEYVLALDNRPVYRIQPVVFIYFIFFVRREVKKI